MRSRTCAASARAGSPAGGRAPRSREATTRRRRSLRRTSRTPRRRALPPAGRAPPPAPRCRDAACVRGRARRSAGLDGVRSAASAASRSGARTASRTAPPRSRAASTAPLPASRPGPATPSAVRRSRAFSFVNALSAVFWRRDRRRALRNSASAWTCAPATALRSRATSLRSDISVPRGCGSTPASPSSRVRRATSASRNSAFFAARRAAFASSTAASRLRRASLNCHFNEPAALRATTSAHFNSSARASAASARSRVCSYSRRHVQRRARQSPLGNVGDRGHFRIAIRHAGDHSGTRILLPVPEATRHDSTERLRARL